MIKDSGNRTNFESGAVRDIQSGKGRCDLMPLGVVANLIDSEEIRGISLFKDTADTGFLYACLKEFCNDSPFFSTYKMLLEVAKHFEEGAEKYGENNWQKGIPVHSYIDSAIRHLLRYWNNENDERHDRAFCWNILCAIWTCENKPELNDFSVKCAEDDSDDRTVFEVVKAIAKDLDIEVQFVEDYCTKCIHNDKEPKEFPCSECSSKFDEMLTKFERK